MKKLLLLLIVVFLLSCNDNSISTHTLIGNLEFTRIDGTKVIVPLNLQYKGEEPFLYKNISDDCW
ncbi:unnamed protein product, partial [marine sediment metagenome]